jgi:hypothetical protein
MDPSEIHGSLFKIHIEIQYIEKTCQERNHAPRPWRLPRGTKKGHNLCYDLFDDRTFNTLQSLSEGEK